MEVESINLAVNIIKKRKENYVFKHLIDLMKIGYYALKIKENLIIGYKV